AACRPPVNRADAAIGDECVAGFREPHRAALESGIEPLAERLAEAPNLTHRAVRFIDRQLDRTAVALSRRDRRPDRRRAVIAVVETQDRAGGRHRAVVLMELPGDRSVRREQLRRPWLTPVAMRTEDPAQASARPVELDDAVLRAQRYQNGIVADVVGGA